MRWADQGQLGDILLLTQRELGRPRIKSVRMQGITEFDLVRFEFKGIRGWVLTLWGFCEVDHGKELCRKIFLKEPVFEPMRIVRRLSAAMKNLRCNCEWHTMRRKRIDYHRIHRGRPRRRAWIRTFEEHRIRRFEEHRSQMYWENAA